MMEAMTRAEQEILLGRRIENLLSDDDRRRFAGRVCLITGAGGSVGSELAQQIAACGPARLVLVDHSEHALFQVEQRLSLIAPPAVIETVLCDVTRTVSVSRLLRRVRPDMVFHAAAYKHVTMAERHAVAASRVNVLGTLAVLSAAKEVGARFIFISSDKAAAPSSVMGATKRFAELAALASADPDTRPIVVRFGNVLASSGSFVEVMRDRIRQRLPVLVTDPAATRFFMAVAEAASLVMKASLIAEGGETFWLDMGPQIRIGDLVDRLMRAGSEQGFAPVPVRVIGLRPGEKLQEQLASQGISLNRTIDPRIWVARQAPAIQAARFGLSVRALRRGVARDEASAVLHALTTAVAEFVPSAFSREIARQTDAQSVLVPRRSLRVREAVAPTRSRAA
jgi:FlaA1/EpsC-like NDP-sugar epimerase